MIEYISWERREQRHPHMEHMEPSEVKSCYTNISGVWDDSVCGHPERSRTPGLSRPPAKLEETLPVMSFERGMPVSRDVSLLVI